MTDSRPADWPAKLARAKVAAEKLNDLTDSLNLMLEEAETAIESLRLGVPGRVVISSFDDEHTGQLYQHALVFGKDDGEWHLMIESGSDGDPPDRFIRLKNASRDIRLLAIDALPALVDDMIRTAESEAKEVEVAAAKAAQFIASLGAPRSK